jgi:DNA-binding CsgD family transcriptional regulator
MLEFVRGTARKPSNELKLTPRETDILQWLVEGLSYKSIAETLFISPLTVQSHIKRLYEKLHVHSKSAAVSKALKERLL